MYITTVKKIMYNKYLKLFVSISKLYAIGNWASALFKCKYDS